MTEQQPAKKSRSRVKRDSIISKLFVFLLVIGISTAIFFFFQNKQSQIVSVFEPPVKEQPREKQAFSDGKTISGNVVSKTGDDAASRGAPVPQNPIPGQSDKKYSPGEEIDHGDTTTRTATSNGHASVPETRSPNVLADELDQFFIYLDEQPYMADFQLPERSKAHFTKILQRLLDQPPAITRETDDYFTLLKNTAHFFRIIGKENTLALKGILDRERESLEKILFNFYSLIDHPAVLENRFSLAVSKEPLYEYACFFLNTIGGRLYLFRRDSTSRMVVSYYAIRVIDKANIGGYNSLGIDLRPFIDSLIEELETSGKRLRYRDSYLDILYDLKVSYENKN